jgi:predicted metal-dependent hydrolase
MFGTKRSDAAPREEDPLQFTLWPAADSSPGWSVRISRRARRLSMRVTPGGRIEVVVPPGVGVPAVGRFVARHREWAERRARELAHEAPLAAERLPSRIHLPLTGEHFEVSYERATRSSAIATGEGGLRIRTPQGTERQVRRVLQHWLRRVAESPLRLGLDAACADTGLDYTRLLLRRQRTRWGSCSQAGTISLNVCLVFQRSEVVRYLMVHELCHRRHMNHSAAYWRLVASHEPEWAALDRELVRGWRNVPAWAFP